METKNITEILPSNYVTLVELQERWKKQKQQEERKQQNEKQPSNYMTLSQLRERKQKDKAAHQHQHQDDRNYSKETTSVNNPVAVAVVEGLGKDSAIINVQKEKEGKDSDLGPQKKKRGKNIKKNKKTIKDAAAAARAQEEWKIVKVREAHAPLIEKKKEKTTKKTSNEEAVEIETNVVENLSIQEEEEEEGGGENEREEKTLVNNNNSSNRVFRGYNCNYKIVNHRRNYGYRGYDEGRPGSGSGRVHGFKGRDTGMVWVKKGEVPLADARRLKEFE